MKKFLFIPIILIIVVACTKTITPALNTAAPQLVIQGAISDTPGPYYVSIVNTVGFYAPNTYPGVSGATITVTDSTTGLSDALTETTTMGMYMTHSITKGMPGHTYLLNISLNGKTYTSSSTMPQPVALDSISFNVSDTTQPFCYANYQDPPGIVNYYKYSMVLNGVPDKRFQTFEDRLSDGRYIRDKVDADTGEIKNNYTVKLCLVGIDKGVDTYLKEAAGIAYNNGGLASPATPATNIAGGCLGYFSAQTVSSKTGVVRFKH